MNKKNILILLQAIFTLAAVIFGIISLIDNSFLALFYILLGIDLFILSYNNYKIYTKKYMTSFYLAFGFLMIMNAILEVINGI